MPEFRPRNPEYRVRLERYVGAQNYLSMLGVQLGLVEPGRVEYRLPFRADLGQQDGVFHGGVIGGIAEGAMGAAAATLVAAEDNVVGADYAISLLASGAGPTLVARASVVKVGRLMICRADVVNLGDDGTEQLCAIAQGTMAVVSPKR